MRSSRANGSDFDVVSPGCAADIQRRVGLTDREIAEGKDAQLDAAVKYLQQLIKTKPVPVPATPPYPIKK